MKTGQNMRNMKLALLAGAAVIGGVGLGGSANAQTATAPTATQAIYSGGGTLASRVYRQLFDCWGVPANTASFPLSTSCLDPNTGSPSTIGDTGLINNAAETVQILYAPVGSGAGKRAFANHESGINNSAKGLGTPAASNTVPYVSAAPFAAYPYPDFHFAGSDDVLTATDVALYNSNSGPANYGAILQIPAFSTPVTIPFNGKDGNGNPLAIANAVPAGGSSGLNLSRQAFCGIFTGHITKWDNSILTALNGGSPLGTGQITVVHRLDGSGTTFLTTNALKAQCAGVVGPNNETDPTPALYEFNYTDRGTSTTQCNVAIPVEGANLINWPDLVNDQCGQPIAARNSGGGTYAQASGSGGVVALIKSTAGTIGYVSPDFVLPVVPLTIDSNGAPVPGSSLTTANLQSQYDLDNPVNGVFTFEPPTATGSATAMSAANPNFDATSILNPINWSRQGVVPNPLLPGSYPISGFTWLDFYQCYKAADLTAVQAYITFHYTDTVSVPAILNANGFAPIAQNWLDAVTTLTTASTSTMANCGIYAGQ
jgi:phosphate transport system substrate-binding protein